MKNMKFNILIFISIILFSFGCGEKEAPVSQAEESFFFKVQFVLGNVKISGANGEKTAIQGDQLKISDMIITGDKSVADLIFGTAGVVRINQKSRVTITSIADKTNNDTVMDMKNGRLLLTLPKLQGTGFQVKTPTAVASVRGTSFEVVADKKGSKLSVAKGTVALNPVKNGQTIENKTVNVETGNKTDYINEKVVEKIISGAIKIPVVEMTSTEKIEIQSELVDIKIEEMPELSLELKEEIKSETITEAFVEPKKENKESPSVKNVNSADALKKIAEEKRQKERELKKKKEDEIKRKQEEMKKLAEEKKVKEEKLKKERASNIPTM